MMRPSLIVVIMSMLAACGGLAYLHTTRERAAEEAAELSQPSRAAADATELSERGASPAPNVGGAANTDAAAQPAPGSANTTASSTNAITPEMIAQWIKDTESNDARVRAAAIAALADAPKAQAMPALKRVIETGEPNVDRQIALRSLYSLALRDGDNDGRVRDVIRHAIYHGDDDGVTQTAQALLDDIEAEFTQREQADASETAVQ